MIAAFLLTASGCWSRRETQILTINSALGFDRTTASGKNQLLLSVLTLKPSTAMGGGGMTGGQGGGRKQATAGQVISAPGATIEDAIRNWELRSSRHLFLAHTMVLVIGEDLAKEGIGQIIDFCMRDKDVPLRCWVVICRGMARDALQSLPEFEPLVSTEIANIQHKSTSFVSKTARENVLNIFYDLMTPGREALVAYMKTFIPPEKSSAAQKGSTGGGSQGEADDQGKTFLLSGAAALRGDKMVGTLSEIETQGALLLKNQARGGVIPVSCDSYHPNVSYLLRNAKTRVRPTVSPNGRIRIEVTIKGTGEMIEEEDSVLDITKEESLKKLEALISREVERRCLLAVNKAKAFKADVFGFGDLIHHTEPEVWKEIAGSWDDIFPDLEVKISAKFTVEQPGLIDQPIEAK
ncbi:MAG: Ger(x)C family spore germination protein [Thermacetogeniaceae bacterium]